jgi:predicted nucleic acid-binding Zn ribbon protein
MTGRFAVSDDHADKIKNEVPVKKLSTVDCGKVPRTVDSPHQNGPDVEKIDGDHTSSGDLARSALTEARQIARGRPVRKAGRRGSAKAPPPGARRGGYSGPGPDENDPQPVGSVLAGYVEDRGWQLPLAEARVFADWAGLVGDDVAAHSTPMVLRDGELKVSAESTAWATQLRLLAAALLARLAAELGPDVVTKLSITGPVGPSWKHGGYSVRGTRGPRDTYG